MCYTVLPAIKRAVLTSSHPLSVTTHRLVLIALPTQDGQAELTWMAGHMSMSTSIRIFYMAGNSH